MKKLNILLCLGFVFLLFGCKGKEVKPENLMESLQTKIDGLEEYKVSTKMECKKEEGSLIYDVIIEYKKPEFYKVTIKNNENNNYQVILKNESGVYVLTPALNKSFKFQSTWPDNTSHPYLLQSVFKDLVNDQNRVITNDSSYIFAESKINSKTNNVIKNQKVTFDKTSLMPLEVVIYDQASKAIMTVKYEAFNFNPSLTKLDFDVDKTNDTAKLILGEGNVNFTEKEILTPVYAPAGVFLDSETKTDVKSISHYKGEVSYTVVQEFTEPAENLVNNRIYGEPVFLEQCVGALTENSLTWYNNGIEYMIFSTKLSSAELVKIANSFVYAKSN